MITGAHRDDPDRFDGQCDVGDSGDAEGGGGQAGGELRSGSRQPALEGTTVLASGSRNFAVT